MQKKLIALAVAGMASTAAFAQSNVTIYGLLQPSFDSVSVDGDATRSNLFSDNNSRIGFKGEEALGNGLKAIFQIESGLNMAEARGSSQDGVLGGRDSWLGLAGSFGSVTFGRHQSAYVRSTNVGGFDPFQDSIGDYNNIMGVGAFTGASGGDIIQDFNKRWNQSVYYTSPVWSGFQLTATYALQDPDTTKSSKAQNMLSVAGSYTNGGLGIIAAYEEQGLDANGNAPAGLPGAAGAGDVKAYKIGAKYKFAFGTTIRGVYENIKSSNYYGGGVDYDRDSYALSATHPITANIDVSLAYMKADETQNVVNDGASNWTLGADYKLSKRTSVQALYSKVSNKDFGTYGFDSNGINSLNGGGTGLGNDLDAFSVRLRHAF